MRYAALANVLFGNAFGFVYRECRCSVGTNMTEVNKPFDISARCNMGQCASAFDICFEEIAAPSQGCLITITSA